MKRILPAWSLLTLAGLAFIWLLAAPAPVSAQTAMAGAAASGSSGGGSNMSSGGSSGGGSSSGGSSMASGGSSSGGSSSGEMAGSGSHGGSSSAGRSGATGGSGRAVPRDSGSNATSGTNRTSARSGRATGRSAESGDNSPEGARSRDGREPVGNAVPRGSVPTATRGGTVLIYPGGYYGGYYDPWWYGPSYSGYYGGYYDPWYGGYPVYSQGSGSWGYNEEGSLKLKIKPREAEVYVDGYFVGVVDDFDGLFQRLHIESGSHRIEVRAPGYETLVIDVRISPDHTTTYQGELKRIQ